MLLKVSTSLYEMGRALELKILNCELYSYLFITRHRITSLNKNPILYLLDKGDQP